MSYPPPPGLKTSASSSSHHPSLPARPPPTTSSGFKPAFAATSSSSYRHAPPQASSNQGWSTHSPVSMTGPTAPPAHNYVASFQQQGYSQQGAYQNLGNGAAPQIHNPFPLPGSNAASNSHYSAEEAAQIAQWQSAYAGPENGSTAKGGSGTGTRQSESNGAAKQDHGTQGGAAAATAANSKQKTVFRSGGGKTWQDNSLLEWDPAHFRLQIGNLAGEVTDESLLKAFSQYPSVQKARVIRDKRTTKSKGYGFVSFSEGDDYFNAFREMKNKYIGSHPVTIQPCKTKIQVSDVPDKTKKHKNGKHGSSEAGGHANTGAGVHKKQPKTKGGLKLLG